MPPKAPADLLIHARWLVPVAPVDGVLAGHAVAVEGGRIVAIGPGEELEARFEPRERVRRDRHALLPGFVDAHTHAAMVLLRGLPVRAPRLGWRHEVLRPAEERCMDPSFVRDGTQLAVAEMLRAGITCFADTYLFPEEAARVAAAARVRAVIGLPLTDTPNPWAEDASDCLVRGERLWDEYRSDPWVSLAFAPRDPLSVGDDTLARLRPVADELDARVMMHIHETEAEVRESLARHGKRPLERLDDHGFLRPGFVAVHMNRLAPEDLELAARTGIAVIACPQTGLRFGIGTCPILELAARGITVGLGSDEPLGGAALDVLAEARTAALLASGGSGEPDALGAAAALRLATLGGAAALGLAQQLGSIEPGKAADLVAIDLDALGCAPAATPLEAILYGATRQQVSDVWIAGRPVVAGGRLLAFDEEELAGIAARWHERAATGAAA